MIEELQYCPRCKTKWQSDDVYDYMLKHFPEERAKKIAGMYGWTPEKRVHFSRIVGVMLPEDHPDHFDGVSYWKCPECGTTWNRFTDEEETIP